MRIGQAAGLLGISTRTIRHYHHVGVLPEPARRANGYRDYTLRDLVLLARARRLAELGMSLEEVTDSIAGEQDADLVEILRELDRDLALEEQRIHRTRVQLAELMDRAATGQDAFTPPALAEFFDAMAGATDSPAVELDRALMSLVPEQSLTEVLALFGGTGGLPASPQVADLYERLDALAGADDENDPRAEELAVRIIALIPSASRPALGRLLRGTARLDTLTGVFSPGQLGVVRRIVSALEDDG